MKKTDMKNSDAVTWGFVCSASFGILTILAILAVRSEHDIGWLGVTLTILFWPATKILWLIAFIFQSVSIRGIGVPVYVIYMCILGFFTGYCLNKLYSKMRRRWIS